MSGWVRVDTRFTTHPKVLDIGPLGEALWLRGLCYAGEHLTDGFVPRSYIKRMGDMKATAIADRLVEAGLWDAAEDGYQIHEYLEWQRSRDEAVEISSKRSESGRKGGLQKASNRLANCQNEAKQVASKPPSKRLADTDTDTDTDTEIPPLPPEGEGGRKTKLPETWQPSDADIAYAEKVGLSDWQDVAEDFRLYWVSHGKPMQRWDLTWQRRVRDVLKYRQTANVSPLNGRTPPRRIPDELLATGEYGQTM